MKINMKYNIIKIAKNNFESLSYISRYSPMLFIFMMIQMLFGAFYSSINLILTSKLIDCISGGSGDFRTAIIYLATIAGLAIFQMAWGTLYQDFLYPYFNKKIHYKLQRELLEKARQTDLSQYDNTEFYDDFILAMQNIDQYIMGAAKNITSIFSNVLLFVTVFGIFYNIDTVCLCIIVVSAVTALIISLKTSKINVATTETMVYLDRKCGYPDRVFRLAEFAKELRLTSISECILRDYEANVNESIRQERYFHNKKAILSAVSEFNDNVVNLAVIMIVLYKMVVLKTVSVGDFTIVVNANWRLRSALLSITDFIASLPEQSHYMELVQSMLKYENKEKKSIPATSFEHLEVQNVSFGYNKENPVLKEVNLSIKKGEKIAIVGYNGAGKSTLIHLLCNLYTPDQGIILYNGIPMGEYDNETLKSHISAVFQEHTVFSATVAENVKADIYTDENDADVLNALNCACFGDKLASLPNGINSILEREFDDDGIILSGGERQKVAIARALYNAGDIVILDEPLAELDPIVEYNLTQNIKELYHDKTIIYISHRLMLTSTCNKIYVLNNGIITEQGNHDELLALDGEYAKMYKIQASKYLLE